MNYIDPEELRRLVASSKEAGGMSVELWEMIRLLARVVKRTFRLSIPGKSEEDMIADACVMVWERLERLDVDDNLFAYLTQMIRNYWRNEFRLAFADWERVLYRYNWMTPEDRKLEIGIIRRSARRFGKRRI